MEAIIPTAAIKGERNPPGKFFRLMYFPTNVGGDPSSHQQHKKKITPDKILRPMYFPTRRAGGQVGDKNATNSVSQVSVHRRSGNDHSWWRFSPTLLFGFLLSTGVAAPHRTGHIGLYCSWVRGKFIYLPSFPTTTCLPSFFLPMVFTVWCSSLPEIAVFFGHNCCPCCGSSSLPGITVF